jgi:hypothetical protein
MASVEVYVTARGCVHCSTNTTCYSACTLQKDGQQLPGKKGIALKPDEWAQVAPPQNVYQSVT